MTACHVFRAGLSASCALVLTLVLWVPASARTGGGHVNSDGAAIDKPLTEVLGWMWHSVFSGLPKPPATHVQGYTLPVVRDERGTATAQPGELSVTWVGHATALIRINGVNVLTDPHFSPRASPFSWAGPERKTPLPYTLAELPRADVVVISHDHFDHLDEPSVLALNQQPGGPPVFVVPRGLADWFHDRGIRNVHSVGWWQHHRTGELDVVGVPARHWSGRGMFDRNQTHWSGWVLASGGVSVYFAGDTGYSSDFVDIGERLGPFDLALLPVGAYAPRDFMRDQHVDPGEAVRIHQDVRAQQSVGIHWGTFELSDESLDAPMGDVPLALQAAGLAPTALRLLRHGETLTLRAPQP